MITTPSSNRPIRPPPSPTPRTVPRPSDKHPSSNSTSPALPPASQNLALVRRARGWDTGFAGQQAGDDGDPLQTLRAPTVPGPATPHRMQGVQRYPALFVASPGPFWRGHGPGVQGYQVGRSGVGGRVLKGSRTGYLWCRGTPGQRRARSRCWCRYVRRPNSWALPHGQDGQQPRTEFDRKANPEMRNRQHDLSLSHDAGTDLVGTAVPGWAISCCGSGC